MNGIKGNICEVEHEITPKLHLYRLFAKSGHQ